MKPPECEFGELIDHLGPMPSKPPFFAAQLPGPCLGSAWAQMQRQGSTPPFMHFQGLSS